MRPVQQVTTELTAEDKAQEKSVASAAETGAEHSSDITDDNRNAPAEESSMPMPRLLFTTPAQQKQPHLLNLQKLSQSGRPAR